MRPLGNIDLNILGKGSREDVVRTVRGLIRDVGSGGGYIVTSGNKPGRLPTPGKRPGAGRSRERIRHVPGVIFRGIIHIVVGFPCPSLCLAGP